MNQIHRLKIEPEYFKDVLEGRKRFEIRKNDRDYKVRDKAILREYFTGWYTGRWIKVEITYITDYAQRSGYVVLGFDVLAGSF